MPVVIQSKAVYYGTVTPSGLNVETVVVDITNQSDEYIVEGWISLRNMASGDTVVVREYVSVDGANYDLYAAVTYSGAQSEPSVRFHSKTLHRNMRYRVTVTQTSGTVRSYPYAFVLQVLGYV